MGERQAPQEPAWCKRLDEFGRRPAAGRPVIARVAVAPETVPRAMRGERQRVAGVARSLLGPRTQAGCACNAHIGC
jgi:hypothetical protein